MVFASLLFVFLFFPLCLIFYFSQGTISKKNLVLLVFSLVFYAWSGPAFLLLLLFDTFISWICTLGIAKSESIRLRKALLLINVVFLLGILAVFKYAMFFMTGFQMLFGIPQEIPQILLPVGISFYTFQLLSYSVDVYRGRTAPQEHFLTLLLFSSLFHQCIAGPIIRYDQISQELSDRHASTADISNGIYRFSLGLAKKAVLANGCAELADSLLAAETLSSTSVTGLWLGVLCFNLQIYLDFSAYSDMAIGMGLMMGFHFPENFNYPYMSKSMKEFWNRWHMTLGTFFRDYVYIPLGGNRVSTGRWIFNMLVVWSLTGLWHGAHLNYVCWGLYSFVFLVLERLFLNKCLKRLPSVLRHLYALLAIYFSFLIFNFSDLSQLGMTIKGMLGLNRNTFLDLSTKLLFQNNIYFLVFCCAACTPLYKRIHDGVSRFFTEKGKEAYPVLIWDALLPIICLLLSLMALVGNSYNPFLYFQF